MAPLPYVVIVSDGVSIRTLHGPAFGPDLALLDTIVSRALRLPQAEVPASARPLPPKPTPAARTAMMTQGEIASASGYTGNSCSDCGSFAMKRTGVCETCEGCGSTSGGCS